MRNIKILIEYDGTHFHGWQYQSNCRSVQGELLKAVRLITGEAVVVEGAGRTDTGVHARGQVGNFKISNVKSLPEVMKGLNAVLSKDVRIRSIEEVPENFHARFSARERRYRYQITQEPLAIGRDYHYYYPHPLDLRAMQDACSFLPGEKDFRSFCLSKAEVDHYLCNIKKAEWQFDGPRAVFEIHANRFLHNMVRAIVGTMIQIGRGKLSDLGDIIAQKDRRLAGYTVPARGLCLEEVIY